MKLSALFSPRHSEDFSSPVDSPPVGVLGRSGRTRCGFANDDLTVAPPYSASRASYLQKESNSDTTPFALPPPWCRSLSVTRVGSILSACATKRTLILLSCIVKIQSNFHLKPAVPSTQVQKYTLQKGLHSAPLQTTMSFCLILRAI